MAQEAARLRREKLLAKFSAADRVQRFNNEVPSDGAEQQPNELSPAENVSTQSQKEMEELQVQAAAEPTLSEKASEINNLETPQKIDEIIPEEKDKTPVSKELPFSPQNEITAKPLPTSAERDAARKRREQKFEERMKIVSGEIKIEKTVDWETKHSQRLATVHVTRDIDLSRLDKTQDQANFDDPIPIVNINPNEIIVNVPSEFGKNVRLDSLFTSITVAFLGYLSGKTNGEFIQENLWLPLGSIVIFSLFVRILVSISFTRLKLVSDKPSTPSNSWLAFGAKFLPPAVTGIITSVSNSMGYVKDSNDDMMLFVFMHGFSSIFKS